MTSSPGTETTGIIGQILNYPVTCHMEHYPTHKYKLDSMEEYANAPMLGKQVMVEVWNDYTPSSEEAGNFLASPLLAPKELLSKGPKTRKIPMHYLLPFSQDPNFTGHTIPQ